MKSNVQAIGLGLGLALALAGPAAAADLKMMTGPQGGSWIPLGGQLKDLWEKAIPGTSVQVLPGAGIANVRGIEEAKADIGFGNSISTVDAMSGKPPFNKPHDNVCNVATLYPQYFHFVVLASANVNKLADLKGKSITTQQTGNTGEMITRQFLEVNGITYNDVKVSKVGYTDSVTQMQDGHAVAFGLTTQIPAGAVMDLASAREIRLIDQADSIDKMRKLNPGYNLVTIPKGHLSQAGQGRERDRLPHPRRGGLQAAGADRLRHDQGDRRQHQDARHRRQGRRLARPRRGWRRISACRSTPAPRSSTRKPASR